jgi:ribosomal protein S18 acetylase RimI-like enzyme
MIEKGRMLVRELSADDAALLSQIRAEYVSDRCLCLTCAGDGDTAVQFALQAEALDEPFHSQGLSIVREKDKDEIRSRMDQQALQLVVEENGRLIALLDAEVERWRRALKVWNLLVDEQSRRQGIGTRLMQQAIEFATKSNCRAVSVEAQATNWPALCFYTKLGFQICGVDHHFYTNRDLERKEVALFLYRELP